MSILGGTISAIRHSNLQVDDGKDNATLRDIGVMTRTAIYLKVRL